MRKRLIRLRLLGYLAVIVCMCVACTSSRKVLYLQDVKPMVKQQIDEAYEVKIHKDDMLAIMINSKNPELALPFNMPLVSYQVGYQSSYNQRILGYLVDSDGCIDFPIFGRLHVAGMTRKELTKYIKQRLVEEDYIKDPVVTVQFLNFKISVIGEVNRPGSFDITSDRITLLEAISKAGDLTIFGRRDSVAVIREVDGERTIVYHDLRSSDIFQSPYYYLQQNDIVYVEPNRTKAAQSRINQNNTVGVWTSVISVLTSIVTLILVAK